ncbi:hypothetical protein OH805_12925 [Streptomyces sp. NBC_00879]|uniref:hypothetical protein n=1 Tax=Streptomyces sp. NBC_00879 TaxID=2975855 RepID=UPI0038700833|nr:hypothetical protein OH805_12925 [Streptomyces sp. NBC_00879]
MSNRYGATTRRAAAAALVVVALTVSLTACGGDDNGSGGKDGDKSTSAPPGKDEPKPSEGNTVPDTSKTLATINGSNGFQITIHSAARDAGGFLTVSGVLKNTSGQRQFPPLQWNGEESQVKRTGPSFAGMTLIDKEGKKRYYVLRDTDGFPLTTTGLSGVDAGKSVDFFAQFPAPPDTTSKVDLQLPMMPTATIEIS